jgi:hypothetical protein
MTDERLSVDGAPHVKLVRGDLSGLDGLAAEALAVFCFADVRPLAGAAGYLDWRVCGAISHRIENGTFAADSDETLLLPTFGRLGRQRLFVFGLGPREFCDRATMRRACRDAVDVMRRAGVEETVLLAPAVHGNPDVEREFVRAVEEEVPSAVAAVLVELDDRD